MTDRTSNGGQSRTVTAFFDTQAMAQKATDDLVAAGVPEADIRMTRGAGTTVVEEEPVATDHKGFWAELKDLFLPDEDRHGYAEGLTRGGHLLSVQVGDADHARVLEILDTDGAVDFDAREAEWRTGGWSGIATGSSDVGRGGEADDATRIQSTAAASSDPVTAASLVVPPPGPEARGGASPVGTRDADLGRTRLRSYTVERPAADAASPPQALVDKIAEHMDVVASDGATIGTVDHLDGPDRLKLTRTASPDGQHHVIPVAWIERVDQHVHLNRTAAEAKAAW